MKDYACYMNRQRLSETGLARLIKLESEGPKKAQRRETRVPQWVGYCGMAASLVLAVGVLALAVLRGGRGVGTNPVATTGPSPVTTDELFFNEMEDRPIPFTDEAIAGDMELTLMEMTDVAAMFGCFLEDYGEVLEDLGWSEFDMEYYRVNGNTDPETGKNVLSILHDMCKQEKKTVIVVTHNAALKDMADKVIYIKNGVISHTEVNACPMPIAEIEW